jgi:hypothetical protein
MFQKKDQLLDSNFLYSFNRRFDCGEPVTDGCFDLIAGDPGIAKRRCQMAQNG